MPTTTTVPVEKIQAALARVSDEGSFVQVLLHETLGWKIPDENVLSFDQMTYDWTVTGRRAPEIGAKLLEGTFAELNLTGPDQHWGIFILKFKDPAVFNADRGMTGVLRECLRGLLPRRAKDPSARSWGHEHVLFICTHDWTQFRFAHFRDRPDGAAGGPPKLAAFGWHAGSSAVRTVCEFNLSHLGWPADPSDTAGWVAGWSEAFSVERVTKRFYREYADEFERLQKRVTTLAGEDQKMFTQTLLNRLMFIRFIERKGWLTPPGHAAPSPDYLADLFAAGGCREQSFYAGRLRPLFFLGLAKEGQQQSPAIGTVPFLNGGLFEPKEGLDDKVPDLPDDALAPLLGPNGLFYRYNFTVQESTPLNVEVAVDPEMLGKVFEELVTGRHESGSYYTPRPIVSFMCREALKGYLTDAAAVPEAAVAAFVDGHQTDGIDIPAAGRLAAALDRCRAVDPACGSGAYLLGLLHEMVDLYTLLYSDKLKATDAALHDLKLRIISHSLYGVDLDPFATNIAMLRLWLSLSVDSAVPLPLPNLDFKIETGDSLTGPDPSRDADSDSTDAMWQMRRWKAARELVDRKAVYLDCHDDTKTAKRLEIFLKQKSLAMDLEAALGPGVIDWRVHFAEVFAPRPPEATATGQFAFTNDLPGAQRAFTVPADAPGGFDIVLANPPYVRMERIKALKQSLRRNYSNIHDERSDLYCYFYARGVQLLARGGQLAFISPSKWFTTTYGQKLRALMIQECAPSCIVDFSDLPIFNATTYAMIYVGAKRQSTEICEYLKVPSLLPPYPDVLKLRHSLAFTIGHGELKGKTWAFVPSGRSAAYQKMAQAGVPLAEYIGGAIHYGIKTGLNEAFYVDLTQRDQLANSSPEAEQRIKHLIRGEHVRKWVVRTSDEFILYLPHGVDTVGMKAILEHLCPYKQRLESRATKQQWYELQQPQIASVSCYTGPKLIYPQIMVNPRFAIDRSGGYINQKCFALASEDLFLLAVLNSACVWDLLCAQSPSLRGGYIEPRREIVLDIPIPQADVHQRDELRRLAQSCVDAQGTGCEAWEAEINERVAALYGL